MYTLRFVNNSLQLTLDDSNFTDQLILNQPFRPATASEDKRNWDSSGDALSYWNNTLSNKYPSTINNITIEVE